MNKFILSTLTILVLGVSALAQKTSNLIIFAEDATPFYAVVNGIKQNVEPQTNVKITGLTNTQNQVKVIFKDATIPSINKTLYYQEMNVEATMKIANTKKGYKLRYFGEVSMGAAPIEETQNIVVYTTTPPPAVVLGGTTTTTVIEETVTTHNGGVTEGTTENVNVDMNIGGVSFGMDVSVNDNGANTNVNNSGSYTSTTTTTTTTTEGGGISVIEYPGTRPEQVIYVPGYGGAVGCTVPSNSMASIKSAIENESFSSDKMIIGKQAIKNKCMTADQVLELVKLFDFEDDRLEYAKYAYARTYDVDNYYKVNSAFSFSSTKSELNDYISK